MSLNLDVIRAEFPVLSRNQNGKRVVYLDNAATSQRPKRMVDAMNRYYLEYNANTHRGVYQLSQEATDAFEQVRAKVMRFINAQSEREIIFTKGATDSINLLAYSLGELVLNPGDTIAVTRMEHHANFVPWQQLAKRKKLNFEIIELTDDLRLSAEEVNRVLAKKPKILAVTGLSNVTGVENPIASLASRFSMVGTVIVVDAAQAIAHAELDIQKLGPIDFLAFSSHKMCGPTGVGVLWGKLSWLEKMPPYQLGGNMIEHVSDFDTTFNEVPHKFEAGTMNIAGVIGLGAAIDYLDTLGRERISKYEQELTGYVLKKMELVPNVRLLGPRDPHHRAPIFSVAIQGVHAHDLATFLDMQGIAVRAGHHCAHPLMQKLGLPATCRASFAFYNTLEEADLFLAALQESQKFFSKKVRV